jgi:hypothetical protein
MLMKVKPLSAHRILANHTLKNAAFFAFVGMTLLTVVCAVGFVGDLSALLAGAIAPMMVLSSLIHWLASLSVAVFLYVFQKTQS